MAHNDEKENKDLLDQLRRFMTLNSEEQQETLDEIEASFKEINERMKVTKKAVKRVYKNKDDGKRRLAKLELEACDARANAAAAAAIVELERERQSDERQNLFARNRGLGNAPNPAPPVNPAAAPVPVPAAAPAAPPSPAAFSQGDVYEDRDDANEDVEMAQAAPPAAPPVPGQASPPAVPAPAPIPAPVALPVPAPAPPLGGFQAPMPGQMPAPGHQVVRVRRSQPPPDLKEALGVIHGPSMEQITIARADLPRECPICLVEFREGQNVRKCFGCPRSHAYHDTCVINQLRVFFTMRDYPEEREPGWINLAKCAQCDNRMTDA